MILVSCLGCALAAALGALVIAERRRRAARVEIGQLHKSLDKLRDDVWRLEAAAAARERAEAASEAKSRFLATVSHEIRTPLSGILGLADLLKQLPLPAEAHSYVAAIRTSGTALSGLIDEILDFSRIEAGRLDLADVSFEVTPLLEGVVELLSPRAQGKGLEIALLIDPACPRTIRGDPARLRQILLNLAGNAVKFTDKGGVGLHVAPEPGGALRFTIEDTGGGIAPDIQTRIFEEFEQGRAAPGSSGTGLGLAISRALAQRMGGAIALERSTTAGSVFSLTLPALRLRSTPASNVQADNNGPGILLLGDSAFELPYLAARLSALGERVFRARTHAEASSLLAAGRRLDSAIVDCAMGEDAARRAAEDLRRAGLSRIVLLLSPYERRNVAPETWRAFAGWLVKPVRDASLRRWLAQPSPELSGQAAPQAMPKPLLAGRRVLLAEDDAVNALIAMRNLERHGVQVAHVMDGAAALRALTRGGWDAAVMDIRMPKRDGLDVARHLRAGEEGSGTRLPLIALSANAFEDDRRAALAAGFDRFCVKPVDFEDVTTALAALIAGRDGASERVLSA